MCIIYSNAMAMSPILQQLKILPKVLYIRMYIYVYTGEDVTGALD